jgi:hypothetical protein
MFSNATVICKQNQQKRYFLYKCKTKYTETERNEIYRNETERNKTKQNEMYTKTGRECNLAKQIYRNGTKQNMSKHTCLFQARSG